MTGNSMLDKIKSNLAENYRNDDNVIMDLIQDTTTIALSLSNRKNNEENITILEPYIKKCVIATYLERGSEGLKALSESGKSSSFEDNVEKMRNDIIKNGLRLVA